MDISTINRKINKYYSKTICYNLSDEKLLGLYMEQKSVKNKIIKITKDMKDCNIEDFKIEAYIRKNILSEISGGTKGCVRGLKFNKIIKNILLYTLKDKKYNLEFEKHHPKVSLGEKPDWFLEYNGKIIIGMNQVDLWGGGAQCNRADKYLNIKLKNIKVLCVVCNYVQVLNKTSKICKILKKGFENKTLCYPKELKNTILEYFN